MKPSRSILDKSFRYVNAASTDVAATFRRIRREMAKEPPAPRPVALPGTRVGPLVLIPKNRRKA